MWFPSKKGFHNGSSGRKNEEFYQSIEGQMHDCNWYDFKGPFHSYGFVVLLYPGPEETDIVPLFFVYNRKFTNKAVMLLYENTERPYCDCKIRFIIKKSGKNSVEIEIYVDNKKLEGSNEVIPSGCFSTYCNAIHNAVFFNEKK